MTPADPHATDRRAASRVSGHFPVQVRGILASGRLFETRTTVDNLSCGGLYMRLSRSLVPGSRLFTVTLLPSGAALAARGVVTRVEPLVRGLSGMAVRFTRTRLLPAIEELEAGN